MADFKAVIINGTSADIGEHDSELARRSVAAREMKADFEARRKACLVDEDNDGADDCERKIVLMDREIDGITEKRSLLARRREEVEQLEKTAECDALVARGEAAQATGLKAYARYEKLVAELRDDVLPVMDETEREVKQINTELREAGDARKVRTPIGVLVDQRGTADRVDVPGNTKLPAVIGQHHFWPRPK